MRHFTQIHEKNMFYDGAVQNVQDFKGSTESTTYHDALPSPPPPQLFFFKFCFSTFFLCQSLHC